MPEPTADEVFAMTTNEPEGVPSAQPRPRRRRSAAASSPNGASTTLEATPAVEATPPVGMATNDEPSNGSDGGAWIEADAVEVRQGAVGRVDATQVDVLQGAIGFARAERVEVRMGAVGGVIGGHVTLSQGGANGIVAREVHVEQSFVRSILAQEVEFRKPSAALVVMAQNVAGDVRVLLDWRGALAFGAAFGILAGLFGRGGRRSRGRG